MEDIIKSISSKISSYNIFNNLLPGIIFCVTITKLTRFSMVVDGILEQLFIWYFCGIVISRIGSVLVEGLLKKIKIKGTPYLNFADYKQYASAAEAKPFIATLSETNNTYRTIIALIISIETILDITIVKMKYGSGKSRVLLYTVPARTDLPEVIDWNDKYLSHKPFILALGVSFTGPVTVNLVKVPHILLGGSTGSGKSVLLKLLLMQALKKGAIVCIADFKGGVDFPPIWHKQCKMCIEEESTLALLTELVDELQRRKTLLATSGQPNIDRYNEATGEDLPRYIFACDEIAEVLDKTGLTKEQKEVVGKIESKLSMIARQGRAFGIHLILATQRPDASILSGQIKNNVNCRICGRADTILSQIILDSTAAAEQIPKDARGRFLLHDGTLFQAYWFDDRGG